MKESQFLALCKLVAIYQMTQKRYGDDVQRVLTPERIDRMLQQFEKTLAKFDMKAFNAEIAEKEKVAS